MDIHGLQKMTLLDYPEKVACTVFFAGCNFRCPYCHNSTLLDGTAPAVMEAEQLISFLRTRVGLLDGVCITGGEPLLVPDLQPLLEQIKALGFLIKLDTNGTNSQKLMQLVQAGLVDYVAMDIKNAPAHYGQTAGVANPALSEVCSSVAFLLADNVDYEFRTTVVSELHDAQAFADIAQWIAGAKRYFLQKFEPRASVLCAGYTACTQEQMQAFADIVRPLVPAVALRGI